MAKRNDDEILGFYDGGEYIPRPGLTDEEFAMWLEAIMEIAQFEMALFRKHHKLN